MPIINVINNIINTKILIWKITENEDILLKNVSLSLNDINKYNCLTIKRKKEFLAIRSALKSINYPINSIFYNKNGKPFSKKNYLSFSHTTKLIAIAISKYPIGVDIEYIRNDKILNLKNKILRHDELFFLNKKTEINQIHIIWGIKESLYKLNGGRLSNMILNYKVMPFSINDKIIKSWMLKNKLSKSFIAYHKIIDKCQLVYVIDDKY